MSLLSPSLEAFWAVTQTGTVLQAAKNIKLTQTGVTQRIRSLEKQLGVTLFTRSRSGMLLTREGEALLHYVKNAKDLEIETLKGLGNKQSAPPEISICTSPGLLDARVLDRLKTLVDRTPLLKLKIRTASVEESLILLKAAEVQIGILLDPPKVREMESRKLSAATLHLMGTISFKKKALSQIVEKERLILSEEILPYASLLLRKAKRLQPADLIVPTTGQALDLAAQGLGFTVAFTEHLKTHPHTKALTVLENKLRLEQSVHLLWYPRKAMPAYLQEILKELSRPL